MTREDVDMTRVMATSSFSLSLMPTGTPRSQVAVISGKTDNLPCNKISYACFLLFLG